MQDQLDHELSNAGKPAIRANIEHSTTFNFEVWLEYRLQPDVGKGLQARKSDLSHPVGKHARETWHLCRHPNAAKRTYLSCKALLRIFSDQRQKNTKQIPFAEIRGKKAVKGPEAVE